MTDASTGDERVGTFLRDDPDAFDALRDTTADRYGVDPGAVEKDYWATEVLRHAMQSLDGVDLFVFKGGTSLSKAYGIIERFSEDIDLLVISTLTGKPLKRLLRTIAERTSLGLGLDHEREHEGRGYLNARYVYTPRREVTFLTAGVLLEMGSRGGPLPNELIAVRSLMAVAAVDVNPAAATDYIDLAAFDTIVLAPERTLAEKLAFLHHRATVDDTAALTRGARHLYDVAMLVSNDRVAAVLTDGKIIDLMADVDERSEAAGWPFTPRPAAGFATSLAFGGNEAVTEALRAGYGPLRDLVWGQLPDFEAAIEIIHANGHLI